MLPKKHRIKKRAEYKKVLARSKRRKGSFLSVDICFSNGPHAKLGITAPAKFGGAVQRNRFKRIARQAFQESLEKIPSGCLLHVFPRKKVKTAKVHDLVKEILQLIHESQL